MPVIRLNLPFVLENHNSLIFPTIIWIMKNNIGSIFVFFNKKIFKQTFIFLLAIGVWVPANAAVATAAVTADITSTITVGTINGLIFGDIASGAAAGTLTLSAGGVRTTTGGVTVNTAIAGSPAAFDVQGDPNATYSITFPATVIMTNGSLNTMVVDNFTSSPETTGVIDASGQQTLFVGATLNVNSNQSFGTYSGQLTVTVDYN